MAQSSSNGTKAGLPATIRSLSPTDEFLTSCVLKFCRSYKFEDIMSSLQTCLRRNTVINLAYVSLRLECNERKISRVFECFARRSPEITSNLPEIVEHPDGFEFSLTVQDINSRSGQLNFGIYHHNAGQYDSEAVKMKIASLIRMETAENKPEGQCNQEETIAQFIHKVRNPLATILLSSSLLATNNSDRFSEDDRLLANYISTEAERIDKLLTDYAETFKNQHALCRTQPKYRGVISHEPEKRSTHRDWHEDNIKKELVLKKHSSDKNNTV